MRHYVPKKQNPYFLSHDLYMQMFYLIRDFDNTQQRAEPSLHTPARSHQLWAVEEAAAKLCADYEASDYPYGSFHPLRAFFDYPYYSLMFMKKWQELGASKRAWNLYRSRFAYLVASYLRLI